MIGARSARGLRLAAAFAAVLSLAGLGSRRASCSEINLATCQPGVVGLGATVQVGIDADGSGGYVGATVRDGKGREQDLEPYALSGSGYRTYQWSFNGWGVREFVVSLWGRKGGCAGDTKCSNCKKNRFHMELQLGSTGWRSCTGAGN